MNDLRCGSLFSGIGGLDLGLERAGFQIAFQIENDPYCQRVLAKHWPDVPRWGDIREVNPDELPRVDLLAGGFPCQPFSIAGRRRAQHDERWLWPEFARTIRALRPRLVLLENVPGLFIRGFGDVLRDLAALGFDAEWEVLPACAFGAPHTRERVFILAHAHSIGWRNGRDYLPYPQRSEHWEATQGKSQWRDVECWLRATVHDGDWGAPPAGVRGMDDGIPARMERLRAVGNAVVPAVAEWIGRRILEAAHD